MPLRPLLRQKLEDRRLSLSECIRPVAKVQDADRHRARERVNLLHPGVLQAKHRQPWPQILVGEQGRAQPMASERLDMYAGRRRGFVALELEYSQ